MLYLYLAAGGVAGTLARYGLGVWVPGWAGTWLPWATLGINVLGSFLLGVVVEATAVSAASPNVRALLAVGFCGAFTTFSTFMYETAVLLQEGQWARGALYAFGSLALGLAAMLLGFGAASLFTRAGG